MSSLSITPPRRRVLFSLRSGSGSTKERLFTLEDVDENTIQDLLDAELIELDNNLYKITSKALDKISNED